MPHFGQTKRELKLEHAAPVNLLVHEIVNTDKQSLQLSTHQIPAKIVYSLTSSK